MGCTSCEKNKPDNTETACECPNPGFCQRHNVVKGPHLHKLCKTRTDYFQLWEDGVGPGQAKTQVSTKPSEPEPEPEIQPIVSERTAQKIEEKTQETEEQFPSVAKQAWNFTKAVANHLKSGSAHASESLFKARLSVCDTCDRRKQDRCLECGCNVLLKAKWSSSDCPLEKWPKEEEL